MKRQSKVHTNGDFMWFTAHRAVRASCFAISVLCSSLRTAPLIAFRRTMSLDRTIEQRMGRDYAGVIGVDEAGRGPLAGPVVVAACYIPSDIPVALDAIIKDSKQMTEEQREHAFDVLTGDPSVRFAVSIISRQEIDELNILQATLKGMRDSTTELATKLQSEKANTKLLALVDGNKLPQNMPIDAQFVIQGDDRIYSIAAASIIAKVTRDRLMVVLHQQYPVYNFAQHKGYPTAQHRALLMAHGPCPEHRRSYGPVKAALASQEKKQSKSAAEKDESVAVVKKRSAVAKREIVEEAQPTRKRKSVMESAPPVPSKKRAKTTTVASTNDEKASTKAQDVSSSSELRRSERVRRLVNK